MLKRLVEKGRSSSKSKRVSPGQQQLPFTFDCRLNQIPDEWHQIAVRFRPFNGIRAGVEREVFGKCVEEIEVSVEVEYEDRMLCCGWKYLKFIWA
jgi:hypothetical protein